MSQRTSCAEAEGAAIHRSTGLWRVVISRTAADWPLALAAWLLLVAALTLLAAGTLYADTVALGGLRRAVLDAAPADRTITVRVLIPREALATISDDVESTIGTVLGGTAEVERVVRAGSFVVADDAQGGASAGPAARPLVAVAGYGGIERHAILEAGAWPVAGRSPIEGILPATAAETLGLEVGDVLALGGGGTPSTALEARVVGTWKPIGGDAYWTGGPLELEGSAASGVVTTLGPLVVAEADAAAVTDGDLDVEWRAVVPADAITIEGTPALRDQLTGLPFGLRDRLPADRQAQVTVGLAAILDEAQRATIVSREGIVLLTLQFAVLAGYAIILVAGVLLDRRLGSTALLRSRGAGTGVIARMALLESILLAGSAALAGLPLAVAVVWGLTRAGPFAEAGSGVGVVLSQGALLVTAAAAVVAAAALTLPTLASAPTLAGIRAAVARQVGSSPVQRLGIDLALVAIGVVGLYQLRLYGSLPLREGGGTDAVDPLLVAAPALGLVAGSVLTIRLVPRLAELADALLVRWGPRGIVAALGGHELARRPSMHTRAILLIVLTAALGTFAATQGATWQRSQADQAAYRAVADVRAVTSPFAKTPVWALGSELRAMLGVRSATPAAALSVSAGPAVRDATMLALDARSAAAVGPVPGITSDSVAALAALAGERPENRGLELPGTPRRLAVTLDADVLFQGTPLPIDSRDWQGLSVAAIISDADGQLQRVTSDSVSGKGEDLRLVVDLGDAADGAAGSPALPLALVAIELILDVPFPATLAGQVEITGVEVADQAEGDAWSSLPLPGTLTGWTWSRLQAGSSPVALQPPAGAPNRVELTGDSASAMIGGFVIPATVFRFGAIPTQTIVPAIASDRLLALAGAQAGDVLTVTTSLGSLRVRAIAASPAFPPLDPEEPFLVVDRQTLARVAHATLGTLLGSTEWWLSTDPGSGPAVSAELRRPEHAMAEVIARDEVVHALTTDPIPLGVIGALGLGTTAAVLFAVIGFLVAAAASARQRQAEFAIMRGLGLSSRQLSAWLSLENLFLLTVGLLMGTALGIGLAWVVLPVTTFTASGTVTVPAPTVVVPWITVALLDLACAAAAVIAVIAVSRHARSVPVSTVIRSLES